MRTFRVDRNQVIQTIKENKPMLEQLGVRSMALFGSLARDEASRDSDVDLLVELNPPYTFDRYIQVKFFLEDLLQMPVDLVMRETLKPLIRSEVEKEAIYVA
jgi:predicted nucleotidyltransferase